MIRFFRKLFLKTAHILCDQVGQLPRFHVLIPRFFCDGLTDYIARAILSDIGCSVTEEINPNGYDQRGTQAPANPSRRAGRAYWPISFGVVQAGKWASSSEVNLSSCVPGARNIPGCCRQRQFHIVFRGRARGEKKGSVDGKNRAFLAGSRGFHGCF